MACISIFAQISLTMVKTQHYYERFEPNGFYHIYNRSIDKKPLYKSDENCRYFLSQYDKYLSEVLTTYSYALCGNHFHFGVQIQTEEKLKAFLEAREKPFVNYHDIIVLQFKKLFISYALAFNRQENRVGTLFQTPFKRCAINSEWSLARMIYYHHSNPQKHRIIDDFRQYKWTSYPRYLKEGTSKLPKEDVFSFFGGKEKFVFYHNDLQREMDKEYNWMIEDA
jgi:putative transposase